MEQTNIQFFSEDIKFVIQQKKLIRKALIQLMEEENKKIHELNFVFCNDIYLHKINVEYLEHDTLTDVITFEYDENDFFGGDIFISIERVKENAKELKLPFILELHRIMIHGLLHLCGYKDKNVIDKTEMTKAEDKYIKSMNNIITN